MYLKELTLKGFKSFASATTLRFEPGITAVIGPNGSGKSNIVDALAWVMGEQGVKNLRGNSMEDVIFAGTSSRPALGRAQVSLTIDNTDHALDIEYTEVTITRTIFRNGGSEYAMNGTPCRLLDIQELLSDTGLGQQMHVIVGQGRLDAILRADPSGHRAFIEEAAGILKHRKRKERALRKLANTESNLARLDDLLTELRRQLGPLGRQARTSRRADLIQATIRDAQSRLLADDAQRIGEQRDETRARLTDVRTQLGSSRHDLARIKLRIEQIEAQSAASSPVLAQLNQQWHDLSRIQERLLSLSSVAQERSRSLSDRVIEHDDAHPELLRRRADELEEQASRQRQAAQDAKDAVDAASARRMDDEQRLATVRQSLNELRGMARQRDASIANLRETIAREESAIQLEAARGKDLAAQREGLIRQRDDLTARRDALNLEARPDDTADCENELKAARLELSGRQDELNELQDRQRELNAAIISLQAKADALKDTLESRSASQTLEHDPEVASIGRLADFIHVEEGWEESVARALDAFAGAIVVPEPGNMIHALERANEDRLGRAVVLTPLDSHDRDSNRDADNNALTAPGRAIRCAADLVSANPHADADQADGVVLAVRRLLSDVAATHTLDEAFEAVDETDAGPCPGRFSSAVTQSGEFVNAVGAVGGSSLSQSDLSLASRRDKAVERVASLRVSFDELGGRIDQARTLRDQARLRVDQAVTRRTEMRVRSDQAAQSLRVANDQIVAIELRIRDVDGRIAAAGSSGETHQAKVEELTRTLESLQRDDAGNADPNELTQREQRLDLQLREDREHEMNANIAWNEAKRAAESLTRQVGLLRDQAHEAEIRRARVEETNARLRRQAERLHRIAQDAAAVADMVGLSVRDVSDRRERVQSEAAGRHEELGGLRTRRDELEPKVNDLIAHEHELDVTRERLAADYDRIAGRIADELGMGADELIREYGPDKPVPMTDSDAKTSGDTAAEAKAGSGDEPDELPLSVPYVREEQEKRLEQAKRALAALGKVNPLAVEEYEALQTRNRYLHEQRDDVAKSRDDLMQLIRDLDATMLDVFRSAFEDTAEAFSKVFATLFPGGTGRLRLENPNDMLSTGVIVEASPAGKRVRQLSLLSGGERSLTALALLFAIFTARPSPFYVMDEVEAALDDTNLTRLLDALDQLREHAQLIVITHQQRTMSIADALYGVTMRSDGVTAVVSQRLEQA
ncbi:MULTISPECIES: chromosome segregation protein SMC [Bifidobacterium]|uniref:chromosome segregation protein SMC n=1 Tax=Bifidobacterium TaxID=1678 RepID=UPI001BDBC2B6|nr:MULTISPECIES: chromosome segregation protein SMC [Bifidobacterium]MBT1162451.1 chromosome segregation protein SMC [Bifidobacterium sp. SO1]MBW3078282.1 chromosome segregation protein SMC [Bifidobacterium simiiventris]